MMTVHLMMSFCPGFLTWSGNVAHSFVMRHSITLFASGQVAGPALPRKLLQKENKKLKHVDVSIIEEMNC